ncbi:MAG: glycosyltransferase family 4 protein [Nitrososphaerota archaeon]
MKIAFTCPASLPATQFGGIMFLCIDLARELSKIGHDVSIYTTDMDFVNNPKTFNRDLPRQEIVGKFKINRSHVCFSFGLFFVNPSMYFQMIKDNPDVIHAIGVRSFQAYIAALIAKKKKIPLVISDQGGLTTHPALTHGNIIKKILYKMQIPMIRFIINQATKISVANDYERQIFLDFCKDSKIVIVRNGVNLENINLNKFNFREQYNIKESFILFLGRFDKVKGIDILLNAINIIKDKPVFSNTKLVIMGVDFGFESQMLTMINEMKIENKVIVIKNPSREAVISAYQQSRFLVLPSRWELSPLTPLEGFMFKKTVISTNTHGIPHTIKNGIHGILIEPENHKALANAIIELLLENKKCEEYGLAGYNMVQTECNSVKMTENTLKIYQQVVNG